MPSRQFCEGCKNAHCTEFHSSVFGFMSFGFHLLRRLVAVFRPPSHYKETRTKSSHPTNPNPLGPTMLQFWCWQVSWVLTGPLWFSSYWWTFQVGLLSEFGGLCFQDCDLPEADGRCQYLVSWRVTFVVTTKWHRKGMKTHKWCLPKDFPRLPPINHGSAEHFAEDFGEFFVSILWPLCLHAFPMVGKKERLIFSLENNQGSSNWKAKALDSLKPCPPTTKNTALFAICYLQRFEVTVLRRSVLP